jgi:hypothetical protein
LNFEEIGWEGVDWINLAQDWDKWPVFGEYGTEPAGVNNIEEFLGQLRNCFSSKTVA